MTCPTCGAPGYEDQSGPEKAASSSIARPDYDYEQQATELEEMAERDGTTLRAKNAMREAARMLREIPAARSSVVVTKEQDLLRRWLDFLMERWTAKGFDQQTQELHDETKAALSANRATKGETNG